jgi:hypothetical protein
LEASLFTLLHLLVHIHHNGHACTGQKNIVVICLPTLQLILSTPIQLKIRSSKKHTIGTQVLVPMPNQRLVALSAIKMVHVLGTLQLLFLQLMKFSLIF